MLRPGRLLRRAARPGLHRRRARATSRSPARWPPWPSASTSALGLFVATVGVALAPRPARPEGRADDVVIGSVFAWVLGLGVLFLSIFTTVAQHRQRHRRRQRAVRLDLRARCRPRPASRSSSPSAVVVGAARHRPARCCSPASTRRSPRPAGVPVRALGFGFLALVGATAAEATQAVGALLLLGLLAAPAGTAQRLTARPYLRHVALRRHRGRVDVDRAHHQLRASPRSRPASPSSPSPPAFTPRCSPPGTCGDPTQPSPRPTNPR